MAFSPANRKEPGYSPGGTVSGGNMTFSRTDPFKLKVIYMSGCSADIVAKDFPLQEGVDFLIKPFQMQKLAETVRQSLDAAAGGM